ncbi:hypothetical protein ABEH28_16500 [Pseudomonas sp. Ps21-P2]|uniref:DUF7683 domain-containing protein n=1 Tax=Pseudomonas sp. Ps21-P2 TaxID=3080331 RepID=UPI0032084BE9
MKYIVEVFDRESELLELEISLPEGCDADLSDIMGWLNPQRGDEGYNLNPQQALAIEALAGRKFFDDRHICQLTCNVE